MKWLMAMTKYLRRFHWFRVMRWLWEFIYRKTNIFEINRELMENSY